MFPPYMPPPSNLDFVSLQEAAKNLAGNTVIGLKLKNPSACEKLSKALAEKGFRRFSFVGQGGTAAVFEISNDQVIRITSQGSLHGPRAKALEQIQSIAEYTDLSPMHAEVMPRIPGATAEDYAVLSQHIADRQYHTYDLEPYDVGSIQGTPYSLDRDGLDHKGEYTFDAKRDALWVVKRQPGDPESIFPQLHGTEYISKQERLFPALADGRVRDTLTDADRELLEAGGLETLRKEKPECFEGVTQGNLKYFIKSVFEEGWYPSHVTGHMRASVRDMPVTEIRVPAPENAKAVANLVQSLADRPRNG